MSKLCEAVAALHDAGHRVVLVSSGAVGAGCQRLGAPASAVASFARSRWSPELTSKPVDLVQKQALAAVGQAFLMRYYDDFFSTLGKRCAQVLLTLENLANRSQYSNARNTFDALFALGVIPVVNENDTVAVEELKFGDNDSLSAQVACLVSARWLFLLTDVDGLYSSNPQRDPAAVRIEVVEDLSALAADVSQAGTQWGTGGMVTKLTAARLAAAAGCRTVICKSDNPGAISRALAGARVGTLFLPMPHAVVGRRRWLLALPPRGELRLDAKTCSQLSSRKSVFPAGVASLSGDFCAQDCVTLCDAQGRELGRGLSNYSSSEAAGLVEAQRAKQSARSQAGGQPAGGASAQSVLGYAGVAELVHFGNVCLTSAVPGAAPEAEASESDFGGDDGEDWSPTFAGLSLEHRSPFT
jgi:glutamate 5-kinase